MQLHGFDKVRGGFDADADHDQIRRNAIAVIQHYRLDCLVACKFCSFVTQAKFDPLLLVHHLQPVTNDRTKNLFKGHRFGRHYG